MKNLKQALTVQLFPVQTREIGQAHSPLGTMSLIPPLLAVLANTYCSKTGRQWVLSSSVRSQKDHGIPLVYFFPPLGFWYNADAKHEVFRGCLIWIWATVSNLLAQQSHLEKDTVLYR